MRRGTLTYSALRDFRNCRRRYFNRHVREIVPVGRDAALFVGDVFHRALQAWFELDLADAEKTEAAVAGIVAMIDQAFLARDGDPEQKRLWHVTRAMFRGYITRYPREEFEVVAVEREFDAPIINPGTGYPSRVHRMRGKVDLLVRMRETGEYWIVEHKSAAVLDGDYLEKLPLDAQVHLYVHYLSRDMGIPISGVIYDVAVKARLKQREGETEEEFEVRRAELVAKSKTGRSSAQRQLPETDDEYAARLAAKYDDPAMFHRETLYVAPADVAEFVAEVWDLNGQVNAARRENRWYRNTAQCFFGHGRPCPYFALCRSNDSPNVLENLYVHKPAHSELAAADVDADDTPAF